MDTINNRGEKIGSITHVVSNDKSITVHNLGDVTTITTTDRNTGKGKTETFYGKLPFGK